MIVSKGCIVLTFEKMTGLNLEGLKSPQGPRMVHFLKFSLPCSYHDTGLIETKNHCCYPLSL